MSTDRKRKHEWMEYDAHMYCAHAPIEKHHFIPKATPFSPSRSNTYSMICAYCGTHYIPDLHNPPADYEPL